MASKPFQKICRVCLDVNPPTPLHSLADEDVRELFENCTNVKVQLSDNYPNQLCEQCFKNCLNWYIFKNRAVTADQRLKRSTSTKFIEVPTVAETANDLIKMETGPADSNHSPVSKPEQGTSNTPNTSQPKRRVGRPPKLNTDLADSNHSSSSESEKRDAAADSNHSSDSWEPEKRTKRAQNTSKPKRSMGRPPQHTDALTPSMCEYCGQVCTVKSLPRHIEIKHGRQPERRTERLFKCKTCDKRFMRKRNLCIHELRHTGRRDFKCKYCENAYFQRFELTEHVAVVHEKTRSATRFTCVDCGRAYKNSYEYVQHIRGHTGEKPYECTECNKAFKNQGHLNQHLIVHSGQKPFTCEECGFSCNRKDNLRLHQKVHKK